jgi:hypothetical protein
MDFFDHWYGFVAAFVALVGSIIVVVLAVIVMIAVPLSRHYDKAACHSFGDNTGRTVKFVNYTYWRWDCLTPSTDGKWISTDRLWEETPAS